MIRCAACCLGHAAPYRATVLMLCMPLILCSAGMCALQSGDTPSDQPTSGWALRWRAAYKPSVCWR